MQPNTGVLSFIAGEWETLKASFGFIPGVFVRYGAALVRLYPWLGYALIALLAGILVYSLVKKPDEHRSPFLGSSAAFVLTVPFMIWIGKNGYVYNGIFGVIENLITWFTAVWVAATLLFSVGGIIEWAGKQTAGETVCAALFLPLCMVTCVLAAHYAGIPVLRFVTGLFTKDFVRPEMIPVCIRIAVYIGLVSLHSGRGDIVSPKKWIAHLIAAAVLSIIVCFYTLGIAMVIVLLPVLWLLDKIGDIVRFFFPD